MLVDASPPSLHQTIDTIHQRWGVRALRPLSSLAHTGGAISTGFVALDRVLGTGGIPEGQITELRAELGSGALTAAFHLAASAQKVGRPVMLLETQPDRAVDPHQAMACGLDLQTLCGVVPATLHGGLELARDLVARVPDVVILFNLPLLHIRSASAELAACRLHNAVRASSAIVLAVGLPDAPPRFTSTAVRLAFEHHCWRVVDGTPAHETHVAVLKNWQASPGQTLTLLLPATASPW